MEIKTIQDWKDAGLPFIYMAECIESGEPRMILGNKTSITLSDDEQILTYWTQMNGELGGVPAVVPKPNDIDEFTKSIDNNLTIDWDSLYNDANTNYHGGLLEIKTIEEWIKYGFPLMRLDSTGHTHFIVIDKHRTIVLQDHQEPEYYIRSDGLTAEEHEIEEFADEIFSACEFNVEFCWESLYKDIDKKIEYDDTGSVKQIVIRSLDNWLEYDLPYSGLGCNTDENIMYLELDDSSQIELSQEHGIKYQVCDDKDSWNDADYKVLMDRLFKIIGWPFSIDGEALYQNLIKRN